MWAIYVSNTSLLTNPDYINNYNRVGALITTSASQLPSLSGGLSQKDVTPRANQEWDEATQTYVNWPDDPAIAAETLYQQRFTAEQRGQIDDYLIAIGAA